MSFSSRSYSVPSKKTKNHEVTSFIFDETTQLVFHHLFDYPELLTTLSADNLKKLVRTVDQLSPNQEFKNAAFQLIQYEIYHHFQLGEWDKETCNKVLPFPEKFHADFLRATNKALYFILLRQHCINHYKGQFYFSIKQNHIQPNVNSDQAQQTEINALLSFVGNRDPRQNILLCSNVLLYKDDQFVYGAEPLFTDERSTDIYFSAIDTKDITFIFENECQSGYLSYNLHDSNSCGGSIGHGALSDKDREKCKVIDLPFDQLEQLQNNSATYRSYKSPCLIILTDAQSKIINVYRIVKPSAFPINLGLKSIDIKENQINLQGMNQNAVYQFKFCRFFHKKLDALYTDIQTAIINIKLNDVEPSLSLSLAFDQTYKIGEHVISDADDILKIEAIAGSKIVDIEKIMKSSNGKYSSAGFIGDEDSLLAILKEDYEKLKHYHLTYKQVSALLFHFMNENKNSRRKIKFNHNDFALLTGIVADWRRLPSNRRTGWAWARSQGDVCSPFDGQSMPAVDIILVPASNPKGPKIACYEPDGEMFGFSACLATLIGKFGFCERGMYYFDIHKFVKFFELDRVYVNQLAQSPVDHQGNAQTHSSVLSTSSLFALPPFSDKARKAIDERQKAIEVYVNQLKEIACNKKNVSLVRMQHFAIEQYDHIFERISLTQDSANHFKQLLISMVQEPNSSLHYLLSACAVLNTSDYVSKNVLEEIFNKIDASVKTKQYSF